MIYLISDSGQASPVKEPARNSQLWFFCFTVIHMYIIWVANLATVKFYGDINWAFMVFIQCKRWPQLNSFPRPQLREKVFTLKLCLSWADVKVFLQNIYNFLWIYNKYSRKIFKKLKRRNYKVTNSVLKVYFNYLQMSGENLTTLPSFLLYFCSFKSTWN